MHWWRKVRIYPNPFAPRSRKCVIALKHTRAHFTTTGLAQAQPNWSPDYAHPVGGDWDIETLFAAYSDVGEPVAMSDVQVRPGSVTAIDKQRPADALALAGLLVVDNQHLNDNAAGPSGRHWVAIRKVGGAGAPRNRDPTFPDADSRARKWRRR